MTNLPAGKELDAAVLRILGWIRNYDEFTRDEYWTKTIFTFRGSLSDDDAEAMRLCGPWLDERCWTWGVCRRHGVINGWAWSHGTWRGADGNYATRAMAICNLVIAVAEREAERKEPTT